MSTVLPQAISGQSQVGPNFGLKAVGWVFWKETKRLTKQATDKEIWAQEKKLGSHSKWIQHHLEADHKAQWQSPVSNTEVDG